MEQARALEADGQKALAGGDFRNAARLFDQAIAAIGASYEDPRVLDDTGLKLVASEAEARNPTGR